MLDTTNELIPNLKGMTSLEIAEVTGKRHDAILRDIRNLLKQGVAAHNLWRPITLTNLIGKVLVSISPQRDVLFSHQVMMQFCVKK